MFHKQIYDYIVVGTGPGGSTVAKELSKSSKKTLIVEHGPRITDTGFYKLLNKVYIDDKKRFLITDGGIWVGRARILGGSSYIAQGNAATPRNKILKEWDINLSNELESAKKDLRVNFFPQNLIGEGTRRVIEGAKSLGWDMKPTPKCVDFSKCVGCNNCMYGCPTGAKWTALEFVEEAVMNGADLFLNSSVKKIIKENGKAKGIQFEKDNRNYTIEGKNIILSAGGVGTPIILQNSGISDAGKRIALDVFEPIFGYTKDVGMDNEHTMAVYLDVFLEDKELFPAPYMYPTITLVRDISGFKPVKLNTINQLRGLLKTRKVKSKRLIGMMTKIRDEITGEVKNDGTIIKSLTEKDKKKIDEAHEINKKILIASGANPETIIRGSYESGHPCCTAPIGKILDKNQETEISNLYVSDASAFPSPLGMPPILTIVALSKRLSKYLLANT